MAAISLTSAPAAKTRSPPYTTTALTSSRSVASWAQARISSCICTSSAFIFGRSSRIVPTPSDTSRRARSPIFEPFRRGRWSEPTVPCGVSLGGLEGDAPVGEALLDRGRRGGAVTLERLLVGLLRGGGERRVGREPELRVDQGGVPVLRGLAEADVVLADLPERLAPDLAVGV